MLSNHFTRGKKPGSVATIAKCNSVTYRFGMRNVSLNTRFT